MGQHIFFPKLCPQCGDQLLFGKGKKELSCKKCGYARALQKDSDQVVEKALAAGAPFDKFTRGMGQGMQALACGKCKAQLAIPYGDQLALCPSCAHDELASVEMSAVSLEPKDLLPFLIPRSRATGILRKHLRKSRPWMLPKALFSVLREDRLLAMYIPAHVLDAYARVSWKAKAAYRIPVAGKAQIEEREVWEPVVGYWENFFEDQFFLTSSLVDSKAFALINDYALRDLVGYDPRYLGSFPAEICTKDPLASLKEMEKSIDEQIKAAATSRIKGEKIDELKILAEKDAISFRQILLPVWKASFTYHGRSFVYLINGRTGKVTGDKPLSVKRIIALGLGILLAMVLLVLASLGWR